MAATVGALRVTLGANTAQYEAGMRRAQNQARLTGQSISRSLSGARKAVLSDLKGIAAGFAGTLLISGLGSLTKRALEYAGSLGEVSQQLGVTTRDLQVFRYAAGQVGISQEEMDKGLAKLSLTLSKAKDGNKEAINSFTALSHILGRDVLQSAQSGGDVLRALAEAYTKVGDKSKFAALGVSFGGKTFQKFIPLLAGGKEGLSALADAAEHLGIVLSDEQIKNADKAADKLDQIKTVLEARIAGVVADNANSIFKLADAFEELISALGALPKAYNWAVQQMSKLPGGGPSLIEGLSAGFPLFGAAVNISKGIRALGASRGKRATGSGKITFDLATETELVDAPSKPTAEVGNFLAGGGGKGRSSAGDAKRKREEALRKAAEIESQLLDAKMDELRAQQQLQTDYVDRNNIELDILDLENQQRNGQLDLAVSLGEIDKATADKLKATNDHVTVLKKQAVAAQEELDRQRDYARLEDVDFDIQRQMLQARESLATTASERRKIELELLDLAYREKQAEIDRLAASKDWADQEEARRRQVSLNKQRSADTANVMAGTRGPWEDYLANLPHTADQVTESLERIKADGIDSVIDGLVEMSMNWKNMGQIAKQIIQQILSDLLRLQLQKFVFNLLGSAAGGSTSTGHSLGGGFASGGYTGNIPTTSIAGPVHGQEYVFDAAATRRIGVGNLEAMRRGASTGGRVNLTLHNDFRGADPAAVAAISAKLDRMKAELPSAIVATVQDAKSRFILR